jgi:hypothetical protein
MLGSEPVPNRYHHSENERNENRWRIRLSLIQAGAPAEKIKIGVFGKTELRRDRRVEVLFTTGK